MEKMFETNAVDTGMLNFPEKSVYFRFFYVRWFYRIYTAEYIYKYVPKLISEAEYQEIVSLPQIKQPEATTETATE